MQWTLLATLYLEKHVLILIRTGLTQANLEENCTGLLAEGVFQPCGGTTSISYN